MKILSTQKMIDNRKLFSVNKMDRRHFHHLVSLLIMLLATLALSTKMAYGQQTNPAWMTNIYHILFYEECQRYGDYLATNTTCGCAGGKTGVDKSVNCVTTATGRVWMDRNLGSSHVAGSISDADAYGDLYQWGRLTDGHEKRESSTTSTPSSLDDPGHGKFIWVNDSPYDWRRPHNHNLWQGEKGINNPCPDGFRVPTLKEFNDEKETWKSQDIAGAFASPLKLTGGGQRFSSGVYGEGTLGVYWTSDRDASINCPECFAVFFGIANNIAYDDFADRERGFSVRCIKD